MVGELTVIAEQESGHTGSGAQSCPTLRPRGLQHATPPCPALSLSGLDEWRVDCSRRLGGEVGVGTGIVAEIRVEAWSAHAQFRGPALAPGLLSTRYSVGHNTISQNPADSASRTVRGPDACTRPLARSARPAARDPTPLPVLSRNSPGCRPT